MYHRKNNAVKLNSTRKIFYCIFTVIARYLFIFIFTIISHIVSGQILDTLVITGFDLEGLEKTKAWYVLKEIRYSVGDQILLSDLEQVKLLIKSDIRRTNLFLKIEVQELFSFEEKAEIRFRINLEETWFILPSVLFELADRNFNVWWNQYHHSLKRVNLGFAVDHNNLTGVSDHLKLKYQFGYSFATNLVYIRPTLNPHSRIGLSGGLYYSDFKEYAVITEKDNPVYIKKDGTPVFSSRELALGIHYRKNNFWSYDAGLQIYLNKFRGELAKEYPDFFLHSDSIQNYGLLFLTASYVDLDHPLKPTRGLAIDWTLTKTGISWLEKYNYLSLVQNFKTCRRLFDGCYLINGIYGKYAIDRSKRPYNLYKAVSYGATNISGYEYYLINGLDYIYFNNELRFSLTKFHWRLFKILKNEPVFRISTEIDLSLQANAGYVNDPFYYQNNNLVNIPLYSTGIGLIFTLNEIFEFNVIYAINHLKETGFYFHTRKTF